MSPYTNTFSITLPMKVDKGLKKETQILVHFNNFPGKYYFDVYLFDEISTAGFDFENFACFSDSSFFFFFFSWISVCLMVSTSNTTCSFLKWFDAFLVWLFSSFHCFSFPFFILLTILYDWIYFNMKHSGELTNKFRDNNLYIYVNMRKKSSG